MMMALFGAIVVLPPRLSVIRSQRNASVEIVRKSARYYPSVWGDHFISFSPDQNKLEVWSRRAEALKKEGKKMLLSVHTPKEEIYLIDEIQRLGLSYHFEEEIDEALYKMNKNFYLDDCSTDGDLHAVALRFRLLRQGGYNVSSNVFNKFKDGNDKFRASLRSHVRGVLNLYEAAFLSLPGPEDDILDEAIGFTREYLRSAIPHLDSHVITHVRRALDLPLHKAMPRLESRHYISFYQEEKARNDTLLEFAKIDFNLLQSLHQRELRDLTVWWKELDLPQKLPFARDRLVEVYYWALTLYYEPNHTRSRTITTKLFCLASVIDDIYDVFGTLEELQLLTNAISRWDLGAMEQLPEYMKVYYRALLTTVKEVEDELALQGCSYHVDYLKEAVKSDTKAYLEEVKWCNRGHVPTLEEHFSISLITAGYPILPIVSLLGMGEVVTKEALDWLLSRPNFMRASAIVSRLLDDIASHKFEQERDHVASSVECYMKEKGVSEQEACVELRKMVANAWKEVNQGFIKPIPFLLPVLQSILSLVRISELVYGEKDDYTNSMGQTRDNISLLLLDPIPL